MPSPTGPPPAAGMPAGGSGRSLWGLRDSGRGLRAVTPVVGVPIPHHTDAAAGVPMGAPGEVPRYRRTPAARQQLDAAAGGTVQPKPGWGLKLGHHRPPSGTNQAGPTAATSPASPARLRLPI